MTAGRPTELDDELCLKIRDWVLEGKTHEEMSQLIGLEPKSFQHWIWRNYKGFADKMLTYKLERRLLKAEQNLDEFMAMDTMNTGMSFKGDMYQYDDPKLKKIKADVSTFVAETVGKRFYSKRSELSGPDGRDLIPIRQEVYDEILNSEVERLKKRGESQPIEFLSRDEQSVSDQLAPQVDRP